MCDNLLDDVKKNVTVSLENFRSGTVTTITAQLYATGNILINKTNSNMRIHALCNIVSQYCKSRHELSQAIGNNHLTSLVVRALYGDQEYVG